MRLCAYIDVISVSTRWNLVVSQDTNDALRQFPASQGRARKGESSRFVEEAVHARILELEVQQAKQHNTGRALEEIESAIDEALEWGAAPDARQKPVATSDGPTLPASSVAVTRGVHQISTRGRQHGLMGVPPRDHAYTRAPDLLQAFPSAKRAKPKAGRHRWKDPHGFIYEWDSRHGAVEVYDARGRHLGEYDHVTGELLKPPDPTREIEP